MRRPVVSFAIATGLILLPAQADARPLRVMALDQCADQYAMALAPDAELLLSPRADDPDSALRHQASAHRMRRPTLETAVGFRPDVVVRYWGGDPKLLGHLERQGVRVLSIEDASEFSTIAGNIRTVAKGLDQVARGEQLIAGMQAKLDQAASPEGDRPDAAYLTTSGFTSGQGTLVDAMLRAAGYRNLMTMAGYGPFRVERVALEPPVRFVLGFFKSIRMDWRGAGRHPVVKAAARGRIAASLPEYTLTCPAWFAADAVTLMAEGRP